MIELAKLPNLAASVSSTAWLYGLFVVMILVFLALDLGLLNRKPRELSLRAALCWTGVWVSVALCFSGVVYWIYESHRFDIGIAVPQGEGIAPRDVEGLEALGLFLTGWALEYALSMDNIFVMAVIFGYFGVPRKFQHRVLFWGILGALVLRGVMIWAGSELLHRFEWLSYIFGAFLIFTGIKMLRSGETRVDPERNPLVRVARKLVRVSTAFEGEKFLTPIDGKLAITPLFLVLLVIESTDVVFAVDSIPAVFGVTQDPFIVFTSNIFAILGLRSLYFTLASLVGRFEHLKYSLAMILLFIGAKMLAVFFGVNLSHSVSLAIIAGTLGLGMVSSLIFGGGKAHNPK